MKSYLLYGMCALGSMTTVPLMAYNFEFKNFTTKGLVVELLLGAGIDEKPEQIKVPARQHDGKPGLASKSYGDLRAGLCLSTWDIKVGEQGKDLQDVINKGGIKLTNASDKGTSKETFEWLVAHPDELTRNAQLWRRSFTSLLCYNRTFAIFEVNRQFVLVTWE